MSHVRSSLTLALAGAAIAATQVMAQTTPPSSAIATVNGVAVPKALFDYFIKERIQQGAPDNEQVRKSATNELVNRELILQDATRKGLTENADLKARIELSRQFLIVRAYAEDLFKTHPITDEALKADYENLKDRLGDREYKARHILVGQEAEAKDILARLKQGEKFEDLAKVSKDSGSRDRGGDLGWNAPASYVKPFADALVKLQKGKHTETPVQTQFGWHLIQLDDARPMKTPTFDEIKPRLLQRAQQLMLENAVVELRAKAKIE